MSNNGLSKADDNDNENSFIDDQKFYKNAIHIGIMQNLISIGREVTVWNYKKKIHTYWYNCAVFFVRFI